MSWYGLGLFLHLTAVVAAFWFGMMIHGGVARLWRAGECGEARAACAQIAGGEKAMPWVALALLATGAYLTQSGWNWTRPWILVSIAGLILIEGVGASAGKKMRAVAARLPSAGRVPEEVAAALRAPLARAGHYFPPVTALGVMLIMVMKPGVWAGVAILVIAAILGGAAGLVSAPAAQSGARSEAGTG